MEEKHSDIFKAASPVIKAFDELGIPYYIGGSIASSAYGIARATMDIDMVSPLPANKVKDFVKSLENDYYVDEQMILRAISEKSSFNLIHLETMFKVDVFIIKPMSHDQKALERRVRDTIEEDAANLEVYLATPEDVILSKLDWFKMGGQTSERQYNDILGIIKVQKELLDYEYIEKWVKNLGVDEIWERLKQQANAL